MLGNVVSEEWLNLMGLKLADCECGIELEVLDFDEELSVGTEDKSKVSIFSPIPFSFLFVFSLSWKVE